MIKQSDVIVTKNSVNGSLECAALVEGYRASKVYYGYTKREAVRDFTNTANAALTIAKITGWAVDSHK